MSRKTNVLLSLPLTLCLWMIGGQGGIAAQEARALFPDRSLMPTLMAGARDPATSAGLFLVDPNPDAHGAGLEVEVAIGSTLPVFLLARGEDKNPIVVGIEAAAFARFGLQVLERELIASDWIFAVPVVWHTENGWIRFRYYHSSSHMGDEYTRRFGDQGVNFSRDAGDLFVFHRVSARVGVYGGARYAYNVHPEESKRWVLRAGGQLETQERGGRFKPFLAGDLEWDQDADGSRLEVRAGTWLPDVGGRRVLSLALVFLTGPSPLGQFNGLNTTQVGITLRGNL